MPSSDKVLTGRPSYSLDLGRRGTATYRRGETVPAAHYDLVPEADRKHFNGADTKAAKKAEKEA